MSYSNKIDRNGITCRCCVVDVVLHPTSDIKGRVAQGKSGHNIVCLNGVNSPKLVIIISCIDH